MKKAHMHFLAAGMALISLPAFSQNVKLAKVAVGMTEAEVREALAPAGMTYVQQHSSYEELRYMLAAKDEESYAFTLIDGRVAAYSVAHILPAGSQPTVKTVRDSITKQTWAPVRIAGRDTYWVSDAYGAPVADETKCSPVSAVGWIAYDASSLNSTVSGYRSIARLMKPAVVRYPAGCGVSIHMEEASAGGDGDPVSSVALQVLNMKAMSVFAAKHPQSPR